MKPLSVITKIAFFVSTLLPNINCDQMSEFDNYTNHICKRNCSSSTGPLTCVYNFTIEWYSTLSRACYNCPFNQTDCFRNGCIAANGNQRPLISVNRNLPGPAIEVCLDDQIVANIFNNMKFGEALSIHWHGALQKGTPYYDGATRVTQCGIEPQSSFQYSFKALDPGTHIWHAHIGSARAEGVFGSLIIRESNDVQSPLYDFDLSEHVILLNDWFNSTFHSKFIKYIHFIGNYENLPDSILINGRGVKNGFNDSFGNIYETPKSVFYVQSGYKYRFRIIDVGITNCPFQLEIENHTFTVIAADGQPVLPYSAKFLNINPGERFDIVLNANMSIARYLFFVRGLRDCAPLKVFETAIIEYQGASNKVLRNVHLNYSSICNSTGTLFNAVANSSTNKYLTNAQSVITIHNSALMARIKGTPNKQFYFGMSMNFADNPEYNDPPLYSNALLQPNLRFTSPQLNRISLMLPPSPFLSQYSQINTSMICNANNIGKLCPNLMTSICRCYHIVEVNLGDLVELIVFDEMQSAIAAHPFHIHGFNVAVVGMATSTTPLTTSVLQQLNAQNKLVRNFVQPPMKDTFLIPDKGYTIVRFIADNPGFWMFHCHLEIHTQLGMGVIFKVGNMSDMPVIPSNFPKCGNFVPL